MFPLYKISLKQHLSTNMRDKHRNPRLKPKEKATP